MEQRLCGKRLNKIAQPFEKIFIFRFYGNGYKEMMIISAEPDASSIYLTDKIEGTGRTPSSFCMLLRKHLIGKRILRLIHHPPERTLTFDFETSLLIWELRGRSANIILTDEEKKIMGSLRRIYSPVYTAPEPPEKPSAPHVVRNIFFDILDSSSLHAIGDELPSLFWGIGCEDSLRILKKAGINSNVSWNHLTDAKKEELWQSWESFWYEASKGKIPFQEGSPSSYLELNAERNEFRKKSDKLLSFIHKKKEKILRKVQKQKEGLKNTADAENYMRLGNLILANLTNILPNSDCIILEGEKINLDPSLSAIKNAQQYFKKYIKYKNSFWILQERLAESEEELKYLEMLEQNLLNSKDLSDIDNIAMKMALIDYHKDEKIILSAKPQILSSQPRRFFLPGGGEILAGKNSAQNDYITFKLARNEDLWFHCRNTSGAHVILRLNNSGTPISKAIEAAARIAAYFSRAKNSSKVDVDYTLIKYVKRAMPYSPGKVIISRQKTITVSPGIPEFLSGEK